MKSSVTKGAPELTDLERRLPKILFAPAFIPRHGDLFRLYPE